MARTPCPHCGADVPVPDDADAGACPACGLALRFVEVPETPCARCGGAVPLPPGQDVVRCPACGRAHSASGRALAAFVRCPRCRRRIPVGLDDERASCGDCGAEMDVEQS